MFGLSWGQIIIIVLIGVFLLGPERIPVAVQWTTNSVRKVRTMAAGAQAQLRSEIGPELDELRRQIADLQSLKELQELRALRDLNPRSMITKNLLGEEFSGGITGLLGLDNLTGSGVAPSVDTPPPAASGDTPVATPPVATAVETPAKGAAVGGAPMSFGTSFEKKASPAPVTGPGTAGSAVDAGGQRSYIDYDAT